MLAPDTRLTLLDALRPPAGRHLGYAVGTTYSLDLNAALTAPAAFALHAATDATADAVADHAVEPVELLESIRRHADRFCVFFQAGQIAVPNPRRLFAFLEDALVAVTAPGGGVFHPKVWVLRFESDTKPPTFRFLCASRNLTFDRSWDTILQLDSTVPEVPTGPDTSATGRFDGFGISRFVRALPDLAVGTVPVQRRTAVQGLAEEIADVTWSLPAGVDSGRAIPIGLDGAAEPPFPDRAEQAVVISPFLAPGLLKHLPRVNGPNVLVSRPDQLDACARALDQFDECATLDPDASPDVTADGDVDADGEAPAADTATTVTSNDPSVPFTGLHAKVFVFDQPASTTAMFTGSANATTAAFTKNVEFICELEGPTAALGVDTLLAEPAENGVQTLRSFLLPYQPVPGSEPTDADQVDDHLDELRRAIAAIPITARVTDVDDSLHDLRFTTDGTINGLDTRGLEWRCRPIGVAATTTEPVVPGDPMDVRFRVTFAGITPFLAHELRIAGRTTKFVTIAELVDAPADRASRLLRLLLGDAERFLRYLLLLLDDPDGPPELEGLFGALDTADTGRWDHAATTLPLLEALLHTLAHDPDRLDHVRRLIDDLRTNSNDDHQLVPDELIEIFDPIWAAARARRS